jgi:hypothetical protein
MDSSEFMTRTQGNQRPYAAIAYLWPRAPVTIISSAGCVIGQMLLISQKPPFEGPLPAKSGSGLHPNAPREAAIRYGSSVGRYRSAVTERNHPQGAPQLAADSLFP